VTPTSKAVGSLCPFATALRRWLAAQAQPQQHGVELGYFFGHVFAEPASITELAAIRRADGRWGYNVSMKEATSGGGATVGVRDLKNHLSGYLERVKAGEEITVTERGRPIARLTSLTPEMDRRAALIEAGIVRPAPAGRRRLPAQRVSIGPGDPLEVLVAQQRG